MATVLTHATIAQAIEKVDEYIASTQGIYSQLDSIINSLIPANFSGDAADGYKYFYTERVVPAVTENLNDPNRSLMASIRKILESIQTQLLDTIDPQLGENNRNPEG